MARRDALTSFRHVLAACCLTGLVFSFVPPGSRAIAGVEDLYLFSYFTGNGEDGLHLASSEDGLRFAALRNGQSFLRPTVGGRLMRDPSIVLGPDGIYHLVWTSGWWDRGIGVAHSKDLVDWTPQEWLMVMGHEPGALNAWAPEIFYDAASGRYLIFWASTIPGRFPETEAFGDEVKDRDVRLNHRIYLVTTRDFKEYSRPRLYFDGGFNVIDATLVFDGHRYALFVKDETRWPEPRKNLRVAFASSADGPFSDLSAPISPDWVEGPSMLRLGDSWLLYYDEYTRRRYGISRSKDLRSFEAIAAGVSFPEGARHGTVFRAPARSLSRLGDAAGPGARR